MFAKPVVALLHAFYWIGGSHLLFKINLFFLDRTLYFSYNNRIDFICESF